MTSLASSSLLARYPQSSSFSRNLSKASSSTGVSTVGGPRRAPICGLRQWLRIVATGIPVRSAASFILSRFPFTCVGAHTFPHLLHRPRQLLRRPRATSRLLLFPTLHSRGNRRRQRGGRERRREVP